MAKRWIGDLSTCFLLEDGWAFRFKVNQYQLEGKPGWRMPVSVAEALALSPGDEIELPCANESVIHTLWLERRPDALVGGEIDTPLRRLGCHDDDLAFFVLRHDSYRLVARHRHELAADDPLGSLLWHSGLDPNEDAIRADPWPRLARAMGGTGDTPEAVAERMRRRGDRRLIVLLEDAVTQRRRAGSDSSWPPFWQYVLPEEDDDSRLILERADGSVRVAVGVLDGTAQPPRELTLGDGGTLWLTLSPADELAAIEDLLDAPPSGLVPAAGRDSWVRWMWAEHAARRAALLGRGWRFEHDGEAWWWGGERFDALVDALVAVRPEGTVVAPDPVCRARSTYPRNALAFKTLLAGGVRRGLEALEGGPTQCFVAFLRDGRTRSGASLVDVLA